MNFNTRYKKYQFLVELFSRLTYTRVSIKSIKVVTDLKNRIAGYRKMLGLTQSEMAERLNISLTAYFNKENEITPFSDKEKVIIRDMLKEVVENPSIDSIFF